MYDALSEKGINEKSQLFRSVDDSAIVFSPRFHDNYMVVEMLYKLFWPTAACDQLYNNQNTAKPVLFAQPLRQSISVCGNRRARFTQLFKTIILMLRVAIFSF